MKVVFDSFFGEGTHMTIDLPYQLTTIPGKSGLQATAYTITGNLGTLNLTTTTQGRTNCYSGGNNKKLDDGESESVQNLTDGIMVQEEFDVQFDDNRTSSPGGSHIT